MKPFFRMLRLNITEKLLILNFLIFLVFGIITGLMVFAFNQIEDLTTDLIDQKVRAIIHNARQRREVSDVFAQTNLIISSFYRNDNSLEEIGNLLLNSAGRLSGDSDEIRHVPLQDLYLKLKKLLEQCAQINAAARTMDQITLGIKKSLSDLDEIIAEWIISMVMKGEDPAIYTQLGALIPLYRENLLQADLAFARLEPSQFGAADVLRIIELMDNFHLRARTLLASDPMVADNGNHLLDSIQKYKDTVIAFNSANIALKEQMTEFNLAREHAEKAMREMDDQFINAIQDIKSDTRNLIKAAIRFVFAFSGMVIVFFGIFTYFFLMKNIRRPMSAILDGIGAITRGDLSTQIRLDRDDEWELMEKALNAMSRDLKQSYDELHNKNKELEVSSQKLEENMQTLKMEIFQKKMMENALSESEERYRRFFEDDLSSAFIADPEGFLIACNPAYTRMFGFDSVQEAMSTPMNAIFSTPRDYENFINLLREKESLRYHELEFQRKDQARIYAIGNITGTFGNDGSLVEIKGYLSDETERKKAEEEKTRLQTKIHQIQKIESLGTLAGGIAHDFNNLLMGIQGRCSLMTASISRPHPFWEHLKGVEKYVESATSLTRQLLGFARGGKYEVCSTDINELIHRQSAMFGRTRKEIVIHENFQKDLWTAEVDRGQMDQVMLNIYVNAWQAMPDGGDIYVETANMVLEEGYIKHFEVKPGRYVKISVTDTGIGMDEDTLGKIFDPFFTTKGRGRGTGLGLASVYGIVKNHGGLITVYSEAGHGSTFNIYLPASDKAAEVEKEALDETIVKGTGTILLVDDEEVIREVGKQMLEWLGYEVILAEEGHAALSMYQKYHDTIILVILDMIMPKMDGGKTYDGLKQINPDIKVILSSGYSINGRATEIMEKGCSGFIQKPFNINELSRKIQQVLHEC